MLPTIKMDKNGHVIADEALIVAKSILHLHRHRSIVVLMKCWSRWYIRHACVGITECDCLKPSYWQIMEMCIKWALTLIVRYRITYVLFKGAKCWARHGLDAYLVWFRLLVYTHAHMHTQTHTHTHTFY